MVQQLTTFATATPDSHPIVTRATSHLEGREALGIRRVDANKVVKVLLGAPLTQREGKTLSDLASVRPYKMEPYNLLLPAAPSDQAH